MTTNEGIALDNEHNTTIQNTNNVAHNETTSKSSINALSPTTFRPVMRGAQPHDTHANVRLHRPAKREHKI
jgi:hypothetical protein